MPVRTIDVRERVMARNDEIAAAVRARLFAAGVPSFNLISSPGAGKTLLLERTLADLGDDLRMAVVTGDVQTQNDADRLARHTDRLVQAVVTHGACHLDARQVQTALEAIDLADIDLLFVENVGNLVCPAGWDLGETGKVVLFSVTEGEDKPSKYPKAFSGARVCVVTKMDLLPHVPFDLDRAIRLLKEVNPLIEVITTSSVRDEGLEGWYDFVRAKAGRARRFQLRA
jgi:hydrogenase nickel incorporation protein HypB